MEPMNSNEYREQVPVVANLEQPIRELTTEEADQVQGGYSRPAMGVLKTAPTEPAPLTVTMTDVMISS